MQRLYPTASGSRVSTPRKTSLARTVALEDIERAAKQAGVEARLPTAHLAKLHKIFASYCSRGDQTCNVALMTEDAWATFCHDCCMVENEGGSLARADVDLLYISEVKEARARGMSFDIFVTTLATLAQLMYGADSQDALFAALQRLVETQVLVHGTRRYLEPLEGGTHAAADGDHSEQERSVAQHSMLAISVLNTSRELLHRVYSFHRVQRRAGMTFDFNAMIRFAASFRIVPGLLSRVRLRHAFLRHATSAEFGEHMGGGATSDGDAKVNRDGFIAVLAEVALIGFSVEHVAKAYPEPQDKAVALLEWMHASDGYQEIEGNAREQGRINEAARVRRLSVATHAKAFAASPASRASPSYAPSEYDRAMHTRVKDRSPVHARSHDASFFRAHATSLEKFDHPRGTSPSHICAESARRMSHLISRAEHHGGLESSQGRPRSASGASARSPRHSPSPLAVIAETGDVVGGGVAEAPQPATLLRQASSPAALGQGDSGFLGTSVDLDAPHKASAKGAELDAVFRRMSISEFQQRSAADGTTPLSVRTSLGPPRAAPAPPRDSPPPPPPTSTPPSTPEGGLSAQQKHISLEARGNSRGSLADKYGTSSTVAAALREASAPMPKSPSATPASSSASAAMRAPAVARPTRLAPAPPPSRKTSPATGVYVPSPSPFRGKIARSARTVASPPSSHGAHTPHLQSPAKPAQTSLTLPRKSYASRTPTAPAQLAALNMHGNSSD